MARGDPRDVDSAPVDHQIAMRQAMGTFALSEPQTGMIAELSERSRDILRHIVDAYCETCEPVGSRTLSRRLGMTLSPATIRNVMADLEEAGSLFAPHTRPEENTTEHQSLMR